VTDKPLCRRTNENGTALEVGVKDDYSSAYIRISTARLRLDADLAEVFGTWLLLIADSIRRGGPMVDRAEALREWEQLQTESAASDEPKA
jgi:hypothetical protein